jgi:nitrite reductase (NO-forming)
VIQPTALRRRASPIDRSSDRWVALVAIAVAVGFLVAAIVATVLPETERRGAWLPLHLALAGGATTAIAGLMPFFTAAFAAAPPSDVRLRMAAVGAVALGAIGVALGVAGGPTWLAVAGGCAYVGGIVLTIVATVRPLSQALGPSRGLVIQGYVAALCEVAVGASIAILFVAGWPPIVNDWAVVKPAHAWLNLVGFVSLVIATTMLHFFPTVVGARIVPHVSARVTVVGLAVGAPVVAVGFVTGSDLLTRVGALVVICGAAGLAVYVGRIWQTRARWTTDRDWHRFAIGGLVSAIAWLELGLAVAAGRLLVFGAEPAGWRVETLAGPLVVGWVGLAIIASATHLLPAIGPGDPATHARQRQRLGRWAVPRLVILDAGVLAFALGSPLGSAPLVSLGAALVAIGLGISAGLLATAIAIGIRHARP